MTYNFEEELNTIRSPSIRQFCRECIDELPEYFYSIPASASGKFHPQYALKVHGLFYHTKAAVRILNHILEIERLQRRFTQDEQDMMRCALILHDGRKHGEVDEGHIRFDHPLLQAEAIRGHPLTDGLTEPMRDIIAYLVATHMGQWNTNSYNNMVLPKPTSDMHWLVHICDYLASRKDITINLDDFFEVEIIPRTTPLNQRE